MPPRAPRRRAQDASSGRDGADHCGASGGGASGGSSACACARLDEAVADRLGHRDQGRAPGRAPRQLPPGRRARRAGSLPSRSHAWGVVRDARPRRAGRPRRASSLRPARWWTAASANSGLSDSGSMSCASRAASSAASRSPAADSVDRLVRAPVGALGLPDAPGARPARPGASTAASATRAGVSAARAARALGGRCRLRARARGRRRTRRRPAPSRSGPGTNQVQSSSGLDPVRDRGEEQRGDRDRGRRSKRARARGRRAPAGRSGTAARAASAVSRRPLGAPRSATRRRARATASSADDAQVGERLRRRSRARGGRCAVVPVAQAPPWRTRPRRRPRRGSSSNTSSACAPVAAARRRRRAEPPGAALGCGAVVRQLVPAVRDRAAEPAVAQRDRTEPGERDDDDRAREPAADRDARLGRTAIRSRASVNASPTAYRTTREREQHQPERAWPTSSRTASGHAVVA